MNNFKQQSEKRFEAVIADSKSWHTNLGVPNWDVIKRHNRQELSLLVDEQIKEVEKMKISPKGHVCDSYCGDEPHYITDDTLSQVLDYLLTLKKQI